MLPTSTFYIASYKCANVQPTKILKVTYNCFFVWHLALSDPVAEENWEDPDSEFRQPLGSKEGYTGFIHQVLHDEYLATHPAPEDIEYYMCGPPMMIDAVMHMLDGLGVERESIFFDDFGG